MGLFRLLLALSVLLSHTGGLPWLPGGYIIVGGPLAVQCFLIISGFYMGLVLNERYDRPALNRAFYINRFVRIFGIYWVMLALYLTILLAVEWREGVSPLWVYRDPTLSLPGKVLLGALNLTVVGQDLPLWLKIEHGHLSWTAHAFHAGGLDVFHFMLIPMAWSLSLEIQFYVLAPFIARQSLGRIGALILASLAARGVAATFGLVDDPLSYRFFPFEIALFLLGVLAYRVWAMDRARWGGAMARALAAGVFAAMLGYPIWAGGEAPNAFFDGPRLIMLALVVVGLPAIHEWSRHSRCDRAIGDLSYPLYLDHLLVFGMVGGLPVLAGRPAFRALAVTGFSVALAWLVIRFPDRRIEAFRRQTAMRAGAHAVAD